MSTFQITFNLAYKTANTFVPRAMNSDNKEPNDDDELDSKVDTANDSIETEGPNTKVGNEPVDEEEQAGASQRDPLGRNPLTSSLAPALAS